MVDLAHISTIFGPKHSVGCFSHSNKTTEPDFVIRIGKFQEFWNSSESVESSYKYLIFGPFLVNGTVFPLNIRPRNPILMSELKNSKDSGILELLWNLWNLLRSPSILAFLDKWHINSTQFYALNLNLKSELRKLFHSPKTGQKLDIYREIPPIPKNSRILGISQFRSQNQVQWSYLSGKNNPHCFLAINGTNMSQIRNGPI